MFRQFLSNSNFKNPMSISSLVENTGSRRRWLAFLITTSAVLVLLSLIWPLSVRGFRSSAALAINASVTKTDESLEAELTEAVLAETSDSRLQSVIDAIEKSGNLRSERIEYRDFKNIRESIRIGLFDSNASRRFQIAYEGDGGADERQLVDILTYRVAGRLNSVNGPVSESVGESFEQLDWIVEQMESDLGFVKQSLTQMASPVGSYESQSGQLTLEESSNFDSSSSGSFHLASSKRNSAPTLDDIESSVDSIDVDNLRNVISGLKANVAPQGDLDVELGPSTGNEKHNEMKPSKTLPINGVPSVPFLLLLGGLSAMVGSVVAWHYDPFATKGFSDTGSVRKRLNVPVIGTLNLTSPHNLALDSVGSEGSVKAAQPDPFANRCVKIASLFLICFFTIVFTFIIFNSEIRTAFFENPFFGLAKIVRVLTGY